MANDRTDRSTSQSTSASTSMSQRDTQSQSNKLIRRDPSGAFASPFGSMFQRWNEEMGRLFEDFGLDRNWLSTGQNAARRWSPDVEMFQRGNELVVRADLPGLSKDDIHVD